MVQKNRWQNYNHPLATANGVKLLIYRYNILVDGKHTETNLLGWRTALAHARKHQTDLFTKVKKVEILNLSTGEIITLEQAEKEAINLKKSRLCVDHTMESGTHTNIIN